VIQFAKPIKFWMELNVFVLKDFLSSTVFATDAQVEITLMKLLRDA
jgi:hypothetical protein